MSRLKKSFHLSLSTDKKVEGERMVLLLIIGIAEALKSNVISIEEAENFLFSPFSMRILKQCHLKKSTIDIIHLGTELENVESLLPHLLSDSIDDIIKNALESLKKLPRSVIPTKKWLKDI